MMTHEPIPYALDDDGADPDPRDCDLMAEVLLPPGVDSAGPWRTDQAGHLLRDLSDGRLQHGDGEAVAACRLCAARDDDEGLVPDTDSFIGALAEADQHTRYVIEDVEGALEVMPADISIGVGLDLVNAQAHLRTAQRLIAHAADAMAVI